MRWSWLAGIVVGASVGAVLALHLSGAAPESLPENAPAPAPVLDWAQLGLPPQAGLVPLGPDPTSGLQEFAVEATGRPPVRRPDGRLETGPDTAVVLVLLPDAWYLRGAQPDHTLAGYDESARDFEGPVAWIGVSPFLLGKYETTEAQWARLTGRSDDLATPLLPRTDLSWTEARSRLSEAGLRLPSEAEWEYACRAGTATRFWSGDLVEDLAAAAWTRETSGGDVVLGEPQGAIHPVGELAPNAFGLHDVHGNVAEWCEDRWHANYRGCPLDARAWTEGATRGRVVRGGSWYHPADAARSAARMTEPPERTRPWLGVRIARSLTSR